MKSAEQRRQQQIVKRLKPKKCKVCGSEFQPMSGLSRACTLECALKLVRLRQQRDQDRAFRAERVKLKTRREWLQDAQKEFNAYIRERDREKGCIDCGWKQPSEGFIVGGTFDAGHYLSVGSHPELRFEEDNCHLQRKVCNGGAGRFSHKERAVSQKYREALIAKIGLERVLWLEGPHPPRKYTIEELQGIKKEYQLKLRELKKRNEHGN